MKNLILCFFSFFFADAPRVDLTLGKSISPGSIYEGGDVYFDCLVIASPKPYKILWFQDVSIYVKKSPFFSSIFFVIQVTAAGFLSTTLVEINQNHTFCASHCRRHHQKQVIF